VRGNVAALFQTNLVKNNMRPAEQLPLCHIAFGVDKEQQGTSGTRGNTPMSHLRVVWVIPTLSAGGIGPVCRCAAQAVSKRFGSEYTVLSLHEPPDAWTDKDSGARFVSIGMPMDAPKRFLEWLGNNPQDVVISNDVSTIEPCFPFFPEGVVHIVQMHDSGRRYLNVAIRNRRVIDGVLCVARNVEAKLRSRLGNAHFQGLVGTVYNGADFPTQPMRKAHDRPLRLLFMGRLDPLIKGIFDLVQILHRVHKMGVPVELIIAGGRNKALESRFKKRRLDRLVSWVGCVPHEDCYALAAESDVFLMTSRREPFGMVTIEAMAMGCVPLAYDIASGSREIIEHGKSGLLLPLGDFNAWADCIRSLHEDRRRLLELSQAAMVRARTHFNSENLARGMADFLAAVQLNSRNYPARRSLGMPVPGGSIGKTISYSRLPAWFRGWVRNAVGSHPHLSWWWLNR